MANQEPDQDSLVGQTLGHYRIAGITRPEAQIKSMEVDL
jgi:hypothetical protein